MENLQSNKVKSELLEVITGCRYKRSHLTAVDSGLLLTGEVEKWTLIPSHYKLLSSFVTVTIFQGERLVQTAGDCWRQTKTHLFLTSRTQLGGRPGLACRGGSQSFNILCRLIKDSKSWLVAVRSLVVVVDNLCLHSDTSDIRQLDSLQHGFSH